MFKADGDVDQEEDDMSLNMLNKNVEEEKNKAVVIGGASVGDADQQAAAAEAQMAKLCLLKTKLDKLQQVILLRVPNRKAKTTAVSIDHNITIFVPFAHIKEKS